MMTIDEKIVKVRDAWFARGIGKTSSDVLTGDELKQVSQSLHADLQMLEDSERKNILYSLSHSLPDAEYEGAVEYLKRTVDIDDMREVLKIMEEDSKASVKTKLSYTAKMDIRSLLRHGGFTWNSIYLDNHCQQLMLDAAKRFALEHPELGFDV